MPRQRNPNREKSYQIWLEHNGEITNRQIAEILGENEKVIAVWKQRDKWKVVQHSNESCTTKPTKRTIRQNDNLDDEIPDGELTDKQRIFIQEYLVDLNATQAAIRAEYSKETAHVQGPRLLENVRVKQAIQQAMREREKRTEITQDLILKQLAKIGFADIRDFVQWERGYIKMKPSHEIDGTLISEISQTVNGIKFKRNDPMKALELIGKHLGMFTENVNVNHSGGVKVEHEQHYHITQRIIEDKPDLIDVVFGRGVENRSGQG